MDINDLFATMVMNSNNEDNYEEIRKLDHLLLQANIPHEFHSHLGGYQITYYGPKGKPKAEPGQYLGSGYGAICCYLFSNRNPFQLWSRERPYRNNGFAY